MSTLATTNIKHPSSASNNIVLDASGNVNIDSNTLYVDATNNRVGIGVASPLGRLDSSWGGYGTSQAPALMIGANISANTSRTSSTRKMGLISGPHYDNGTDIGFIRFDSASTVTELQLGGTAEKRGATVITFHTAATTTATPSERMRIEANGRNRCFGADEVHESYTGSAAGTSISIYTGGYNRSTINSGGTTSYYVWSNGNVQNSNNSYTGISDIKLKENIVDANSQWDDLKALQVRNYNFKEGQTHTQIGLVAQEVELVSPGLVSESPDRDAEGNDLGTVTKSVNYSVLYMKAVKALQEAIAKIEALEGMVAVNNITIDEQQHQLSTLEARLTALESPVVPFTNHP
jgi:uncharacterized coiled-coil protein SlyX